MKKTIIINTHLCSKSEILYFSLAGHKDIKGCWNPKEMRPYLNNMRIIENNKINHKSKNKKSFYLDQVRYNHELSTKLIDFSKLIIISLIRKPEESIRDIIIKAKKSPLEALRNYTFRIKRIYQVANKCNNSIFLTYEQLSNKNVSIFLEKELSISNLEINYLKDEEKESFNIKIPKQIIKESVERYEFYHNLFIKNKKIKSIYSCEEIF